MQNKDIDKLQTELTGYAIDIASAFGYQLTYSNQSIKDVDEILGLLHKEYRMSGSKEGLDGVALEFAFYIGGVMNHNYSTGYFERDYDGFGKNTYPFYWRDKVLFLYSWCQKRIYDGDSDNIWIKYSIIVMELDEDRTPKRNRVIDRIKSLFNR